MDEKKFNIFATVGIILIAVVIGFLTFWELNTPKEVSIGKTPPTQNVANDKPAAGTIVYLNNDFGFTVTLPSSWSNYSLVKSMWAGIAINSPSSTLYTEGPIISIRSPLWTSEAPRQDIPVMVFTLKQWDELQRDIFHIGAAPVNPSELGRNANYVFALPARYNFAFLPGYEEVQQIIEAKSLRAF
ncbi:MAG TPA: hypothetical protein VJ579_03820 [Candidatus Paceibacterota bacterium]|nr:hypothetical protein [Candidatus Paceibacterota bacterium]